MPLLGSLPLDIRIREQGDAGAPIAAVEPESAVGQAYRQVAERLLEVLGQRPRATSSISATLL